VADDQLKIGALSEAERNLHRRIDLCREIEDEGREGIGHLELGRVLSYRGAWGEAEQELDLSFNYDTKQNDYQGLSVDWSYRALRFLLLGRQTADDRQSQIENRQSAIECAHRALELADEQAKDIPVPRDYVRAHWLLGAAYLMNNELEEAEENLSKALSQCRQINMVDHEANILLDIARLSFAYALRAERSRSPEAEELFKDAQEKASEALVITERSGYVLQGADVHLFLATLALEVKSEKLEVESWGGKGMARKYAKEALRLATCDGGEYKYKVAYEEAERMLEKLK
jgi:tetratricopeptide (TPR) repeat protein